MTPYEWMLDAIAHGTMPCVLGDLTGPAGGSPVFCMPMHVGDGRILAPAHHFFAESQRTRAFAHIGLAVGAHREWARLAHRP